MADHILEDTLNDYALERNWIFVVPARHAHFMKHFLKRRLDKYPYLFLVGTTLRVIDGRRPTGDRAAPYEQKCLDIADPTCFDQVESFLSATGRI